MASIVPRYFSKLYQLPLYLHCVSKSWNKSAMMSTSTDPSISILCNKLKTCPPGSKSLRHLDQLGQLVLLLSKEPESSREVWNSGVVPTLVEHSTCGQTEMESQARMALSLLGFAPPYTGRGLRILSIDGGGTRCASNHSTMYVCACTPFIIMFGCECSSLSNLYTVTVVDRFCFHVHTFYC